MKITKLIISFLLILQGFIGTTCYAFEFLTFRRGTATVIFASLSGAVLGLSTLPFYPKPEEHTNNIMTGALIGLAAGVGYVGLSDDTSTAQTAMIDRNSIQSKSISSKYNLSISPIVPLLTFKYEF